MTTETPQSTSWATTFEDDFLARCRVSREAKGWSQRELARRLNAEGLRMHPSSMAKTERTDDTRRPLSLAEAAAMSVLLDVPMSTPLLAVRLAHRRSVLGEQIERLTAEFDNVCRLQDAMLRTPTAADAAEEAAR